MAELPLDDLDALFAVDWEQAAQEAYVDKIPPARRPYQ